MLAILLLACTGGCASSSASSVAPSGRLTPSRDAAVVQFRAVVNADMRVITYALDREGCKTRRDCAAELLQIRAATQALLVDLGRDAPPTEISVLVEQLKL